MTGTEVQERVETRAPQRGVALLCGAGGRITHVLRDHLGMAGVAPTRSLREFVDAASEAKLAAFLRCVEARQVAFDWELVVPVGRRREVWHFAGEPQGEGMLVLAAPSVRELFDLLRASSSTASVASAEVRDPEAVLADLTSVNNELANMHREVARQRSELADANRRLREQDAWRARFVAVLSHELRNGLQAVVGNAELLRRRTSGTVEQQQDADALLESALHVMAVLGDVLELAQLEAGRVDLQGADVDLGEVAGEVLDRVRTEARAKGIGLELRAGAGVVVRTDRRRVRQVLLNLIGNAVKFTELGGVTVEVGVEDEAGAVLVSVIDTGPGIPQERLGELFEAFSRLPGSAAAEQEGTGLGLFLCRNLVERLGGSIGVERREGPGSRFWFRLPGRPVAALDADQRAPERIG